MFIRYEKGAFNIYSIEKIYFTYIRHGIYRILFFPIDKVDNGPITLFANEISIGNFFWHWKYKNISLWEDFKYTYNDARSIIVSEKLARNKKEYDEISKDYENCEEFEKENICVECRIKFNKDELKEGKCEFCSEEESSNKCERNKINF
jgi:hypothetical protein